MNGNVDLLKIYFGDPYPISDKITLYQPSIQDIIDYGESDFFAVLFMFIGNTTYRKLFLWDNGIDWNKMSDYELFCGFVRMLPPEKTKIFFGDLDFTKFELFGLEYTEPEPTAEEALRKPTATEKRNKLFQTFEKSHTLYSKEQDIEISAETYHSLMDVMRNTVHIFPKVEYTTGKTSKELLIEEEREKVKKAEREAADHPVSSLQPLISMCVNHPGFKYKSSELKQIHINEFMDSVNRLQVYESTHAMYIGSRSGFIDTSKIPKEQFDFTRQL